VVLSLRDDITRNCLYNPVIELSVHTNFMKLVYSLLPFDTRNIKF